MSWSSLVTCFCGFECRPHLHPPLGLCNLYSKPKSPKWSFNQSSRKLLPVIVSCSEYLKSQMSPASEEEEEDEEAVKVATLGSAPPAMRRRRRRYRKQYPGERKGITEEMRFVAMKLRNFKPKVESNYKNERSDGSDGNEGGVDGSISFEAAGGGGGRGDGDVWKPSMEGFLKYLVDSKLVFDTVERIVDESSDVSYAYFRKTGLERSEGLSKDMDWFRQQHIVIPEPSNPGVTYSKHLEELANKTPPLFLSHFYNIYFSHIAGGQIIAKKVSKKLLEGKELEFYKWEGNSEELLRGVREKLNMLGENWSRDDKNKCLREATKSFRFLGQIVRLIIL